jgi:amidase
MPNECVLMVQGKWTLQQWLSVFRTLQSSEVWRTHGSWIEQHSPQFGPGIRERFDAASKVDAKAVEECKDEQTR